MSTTYVKVTKMSGRVVRYQKSFYITMLVLQRILGIAMMGFGWVAKGLDPENGALALVICLVIGLWLILSKKNIMLGQK